MTQAVTQARARSVQLLPGLQQGYRDPTTCTSLPLPFQVHQQADELEMDKTGLEPASTVLAPTAVA